MKRKFDAACRQYEVKTVQGNGEAEWPDGLKSGFPSVVMLGKVEQQSYTGKNLFNVMAIPEHPNWGNGVTAVDETRLVASTLASYTGNGAIPADVTLQKVAPGLEVGKTYVLSFVTDSARNNLIFLVGSGVEWRSGASKTITEAMLQSTVYVYGFRQSDGEGTGDCRISNIQIEEGTVVTAYEPYVGGIPSPNPQYPQEIKANNAVVRSLGKNLANAFIDNSQYLAQTEKIAENTFQVTIQKFGYGQIKIEGLPKNRALRLVCTCMRDESVEPKEARLIVWPEANAKGGMYADVYIPIGNAKMSAQFAAPSGYIYCGLYPQALGHATTYHISVYTDESAVLEHTPYFNGGEAIALNLMCAVDGSRQSTYDTQTGEFVNWWHDKLVFNGSEEWSHYSTGDWRGFVLTEVFPTTYLRNAYWSNQFPAMTSGQFVDGQTHLWCGFSGTGWLAVISRYGGFTFYDETLADKGLANWKAHLAEHPLEVWVARNEPEIINGLAQRMTCPTGYGQIVQVMGYIEDCPLEIKYLAHGGNVK